MAINLDNVDADQFAQLRYGVQSRETFPGPQLTNMNSFSNLCFNTAAEFVDTSVTSLENTGAGQKCQAAMIQQLALNGREHPGLKLRMPVVLSKPQYFKDAYLATRSIDDAYKISVNSCITNQSPGIEQTSCVERCGNARDTLLLTIANQRRRQRRPQPHIRHSGDIPDSILGSKCVSSIQCGQKASEQPLKKSLDIASEAAVVNLTAAELAKKSSALVYEPYDKDSDDKDSDDKDSGLSDDDNGQGWQCGMIIFTIFIIVAILLLIGSLCSGGDKTGGQSKNFRQQGQIKNAFASKRKKHFSRKR